MRNIRHIFCTLILLLSFSGKAQDTLFTTQFTPQFDKTKYYQISTKYGAQFRGRVTEETAMDITLHDRRGNLKHHIYKSDIKEVTPLGMSAKDNISRFDDDYYSNYYMLVENALPFREGSFSATAHYLVENCNYAFSEHWSASLNIIFVLPTSIGVKCSYEIGRELYLGGNVYVWGLPEDNSSGKYYVPFLGASVKLTKGDNNTNFTLGAGSIAIKDFDKSHNVGRSSDYIPLYYLNFAYTNRFSKHGAFNIESFLFPEVFSRPYQTVSLGMTGVSIKWIRDMNTQWNFGCYGLYLGDLRYLNSNSKIFPFPYLSYTYIIK